MEVRLVSEDGDISRLCTAALSDVVQGRQWSLASSGVEGLGSPADLYLWDFQPGVLPQGPIQCTSFNLIAMLNRRDLPALKNFLGFEPNVLLKPVSAGALSVMLHFAVSSGTLESLHGDREHLLQNLLEANLKLQEYDQERRVPRGSLKAEQRSKPYYYATASRRAADFDPCRIASKAHRSR